MHLNFSKCYFHCLRKFKKKKKTLKAMDSLLWQIHGNRYKLCLPVKIAGRKREGEEEYNSLTPVRENCKKIKLPTRKKNAKQS